MTSSVPTSYNNLYAVFHMSGFLCRVGFNVGREPFVFPVVWEPNVKTPSSTYYFIQWYEFIYNLNF